MQQASQCSNQLVNGRLSCNVPLGIACIFLTMSICDSSLTALLDSTSARSGQMQLGMSCANFSILTSTGFCASRIPVLGCQSDIEVLYPRFFVADCIHQAGCKELKEAVSPCFGTPSVPFTCQEQFLVHTLMHTVTTRPACCKVHASNDRLTFLAAVCSACIHDLLLLC